MLGQQWQLGPHSPIQLEPRGSRPAQTSVGGGGSGSGMQPGSFGWSSQHSTSPGVQMKDGAALETDSRVRTLSSAVPVGASAGELLAKDMANA